MEKELGVTKARENFSEIVEKVQYEGDAYLISRHGKPAAAVVPLEVYENWKRQRRNFFDTIRQIQDANEDVDPDQAWEDVLQAQSELRKSD